MRKIPINHLASNFRMRPYASLSFARRIMFRLDRAHTEHLKVLVEIAEDYMENRVVRLFFEITIKFIYEQNIVYLEGMIALVDLLLTKIKPVKAKDYNGQYNFMKFFSRHLKNIIKYIFEKDNFYAHVLTQKIVENWFQTELISEEKYEELKKVMIKNK